jgi:hypothetical protein
VEEAISEGSIDGLLTDGVKAVVRAHFFSLPFSSSYPPLYS